VFLCAISLGLKSWGQESSAPKTISMSALDAVKMAGNMVDSGDYDNALTILTKMPQTNNLPVEIERWYLLAQIEQRKGNIDEAIRIYRKILDDQPDLVKIRYELAVCYMLKHQWYRADYHLRLALAGKDIPDEVKQHMMYLRYIVRQNKNWNVWFNFGAAPDTNINQAHGGKECITNEWGTFCRSLSEPEKALGTNFMLGGDYEFKLSDNWRWKNDGMIYTNIYDKHKYDDFYLSSSTGPRYVWEKGDVWLAGVLNRRWYGWDKYNWAYGGKIDANYDFSRKLSSGLILRVMDNLYDEYGDWMDGQTYTAIPHISYSLDSTKFVSLRANLERETAKVDAYANRKYGGGFGFGSELPYGFNIYLEPYFQWINYDGKRYVVKDNVFQALKERDFLQRYSVSLSNGKLGIKGFVPIITVSYTKKDSNIPSREYEKWTTEFTMRQRF
jgi:Tfp pilus assembly protein PilF